MQKRERGTLAASRKLGKIGPGGGLVLVLAVPNAYLVSEIQRLATEHFIQSIVKQKKGRNVPPSLGVFPEIWGYFEVPGKPGWDAIWGHLQSLQSQAALSEESPLPS